MPEMVKQENTYSIRVSLTTICHFVRILLYTKINIFQLKNYAVT